MDRNFTDGDGSNGTIPATVAWCTDGGSVGLDCVNIETTYTKYLQNKLKQKDIIVEIPSVIQIAKATGTDIDDYEQIKEIPKWLYNNLNNQISEKPHGYWTKSLGPVHSLSAWYCSGEEWISG